MGEHEERCRRCGGADLHDATETLSVELARTGVRASVAVPARRCRVCDDVEVHAPVRARALLALACELGNAGVCTGEALRLMRRALGLRGADLARLLDVRPETISHWETGKCRPNRAAFVALGAMIEDALAGRTATRDRLAAVAEERGYPPVLAVKLR